MLTESGLKADWKRTESGLKVDWKWTKSGLKADSKLFVFLGHSLVFNSSTFGSKRRWWWLMHWLLFAQGASKPFTPHEAPNGIVKHSVLLQNVPLIDCHKAFQAYAQNFLHDPSIWVSIFVLSIIMMKLAYSHSWKFYRISTHPFKKFT